MRAKSLKERVLAAGSLTVVGHFISLAFRFASTLVLTRVFSPQTYGVLAIVWVAYMVISLLTDIGIRQAVIQSPRGGTAALLNTAWSLQVIRGWAIFVVGMIVSAVLLTLQTLQIFPLNSAYTTGELPGYIFVVSAGGAILGFQSMKSIIANRDLNLKRVVGIDLFSQFIGLAFVTIAGVATQSIWSFVAGSLLTSALTVALGHLWLQGPKDQFGWNKKSLGELVQFGRWVFVSSAVGVVGMNGDRLLLAAWMNTSALGMYSLANNLVSLTDSMSDRLSGGVSLPVLSEIFRTDPKRFSELYHRMRWWSDIALTMVAGFLFGAGPAIVEFLYDPRYAAAGEMLQILSFSLLFSKLSFSQASYLALGEPKYVTIINFTKVASLFLIVPISYSIYGLTGALIAIAFHQLPNIFWTFVFDRRHSLSSGFQSLKALLFWPLGFLCGLLSSRIFELSKPTVSLLKIQIKSFF